MATGFLSSLEETLPKTQKNLVAATHGSNDGDIIDDVSAHAEDGAFGNHSAIDAVDGGGDSRDCSFPGCHGHI